MDGAPPGYLLRRRAGGHDRPLLAGVAARQGEADRGGGEPLERGRRPDPPVLPDDQQRPLRSRPSGSRPRAASCSSSSCCASSCRCAVRSSTGHDDEGRGRRHDGDVVQRRLRQHVPDGVDACCWGCCSAWSSSTRSTSATSSSSPATCRRASSRRSCRRTRRLRDRRAQRDREHGRRRHLRLRAAPGRAAGRPLRRRVGPRDGGGPRDGRRARGVPHAARRRPVAAGHVRDAEPHPLPHRRPARVLLAASTSCSRDDGSFAGSVAGHPQPLLIGADGSRPRAHRQGRLSARDPAGSDLAGRDGPPRAGRNARSSTPTASPKARNARGRGVRRRAHRGSPPPVRALLTPRPTPTPSSASLRAFRGPGAPRRRRFDRGHPAASPEPAGSVPHGPARCPDPEPAWQGLTYLELPAIRAG